MDAQTELQKEIKQLRGLFKGRLNEEQLLEKAIELRAKRKEKNKNILDASVIFSNKAEKKQANKLLEKYTSNFSIETISDKNILLQVVYLEIIQNRLQDKLNEFNETNKSVPSQLIKLIHENQNQILSLKEKLGILRNKELGTFDKIAVLMEKAKIWRQNNQASRTTSCPHCGQMILWKIRSDIWELQKHPFFKDKILGNPHLVKMYQEGKIKKEDVAKILEVSDGYVDWLIDLWGKND